MPIAYIHGVNTRDPTVNEERAATISMLLDEYALSPTSLLRKHLSTTSCYPIYWGDLAASKQRRRHDLEVPEEFYAQSISTTARNTVPVPEEIDLELHLSQGQGADDATFDSDVISMGGIGSAGVDFSPFFRAAANDISSLMYAAAPALAEEVVRSARQMGQPEGSRLGILRAAVVIAVNELARDPSTRDMLDQSSSDNDLLERINDRLIQNPGLSDALRNIGAETDLQRQSLSGDILRSALVRIASSRLGKRLAHKSSLWLLSLAGATASETAMSFFGDVIVYLTSRGNQQAPGEIVRRLSNELTQLRALKPDEPLIVISHSFGSILVLDLITHFDTAIEIDAWISVGSLLRYFADLNAFKADPPTIAMTVADRIPNWLNVTSALDVLSEPVNSRFSHALEFDLPSEAHIFTAHNHYFESELFYRQVGQFLESIHGI